MYKVTYNRVRLVVQDCLDLLHNFWRQLGNHLECLEVIENLFRLRSAKDDCRGIRIFGDPCKGEMGDLTSKL